MSITTTVHLNFRGQAREALEFYQSVFGGELAVATYADAQRVSRPEEAGQVIWGQVQSAAGFHVMAFDVPGERAYDPGVEAVFVSVRSQEEDEIRRYWDELVKGGTIREDLAPSGWSKLYGMVKDRFGVIWVLDVVAPYPG